MSKRVTRGWLRAGIVTAMGAAAIIAAVTLGAFGGHSSTQNASAAGSCPTSFCWAAVPQGGNVFTAGSWFDVYMQLNDSDGTQWGGYAMELQYPGFVQVNSTLDGNSATPPNAPGTCTNAAGNWGAPQNSPTVQTGCAFQTNTVGGTTEVINFTCIGTGTGVLHMETLAEDSASGTQVFDVNAVPLPLTTTDATITCSLPITKSHTGGASIPATASSSTTYTINVGNASAFSSGGHTVTDNVPAPLVVTGVTSTNGALDGCSFTGNAVTCSTLTANAGGGNNVQITASIPLSAAGTNNVCNKANLDGVLDSNNDCFNIPGASLSVTKTADQASVQAGDPISWTIVVTSNGPSTAAGVTVNDTPTDGWTATDPTSYNLGDLASGATQTIVIHGNVNDPNPSDSTYNNSVAVASTNGASASASAQTSCLSKNVRMVKSTDCNNAPLNSGENANLFLDNGGVKANGLTPLTICEWALNVGGDPQGVGAFEFDVSYDNRVFDIAVAGTPWLYSTGRVADATNSTDPAVGCAATVITENDVRFGCVSKNPQPLNGANGNCLGPDDTTPVSGAVCGPKNDAPIATITLTPKADLLSRITPGNDNGVIRSILDSGCEFADIWGHPLETAGNGGVLPGIAPGGQVIDCSNVTVTVRILEGDMNTDCTVDVTDDQMEAAHYAATFGSLLYDPWYDLEPALKDGDVDIKDLQKVFGRNGSTCASPVPPQNALPQPGDP